jgi:hypothetical protein
MAASFVRRPRVSSRSARFLSARVYGIIGRAGRQFTRLIGLMVRIMRTAKVCSAINKVSSRLYFWLASIKLVTVAGGTLASCNAAIGVSPALQATYRENTLITSPDSDDPHVALWGPPETNTGGGG